VNTFHSWRHTFRTRLAEAGVSDEIAKWLGGWTVDKTALRYDHDGRIAELAAAVEPGSRAGDGKARDAAEGLIAPLKDMFLKRKNAWVFLNNQFEGCAPKTIDMLREMMGRREGL